MKNFFAILLVFILLALWLVVNLLKMTGGNPSLIFSKENIIKTAVVGLFFLVLFFIVDWFKRK